MKVTRLTIANVGIIQNETIEINKPELIFFGDIKQGKSTILNAVRWAFGGAFPADLIRHGQDEASVQIEGADADGRPWVIRREWYRAKDGAVTSRPITYTRGGVPVRKPVDAIKAHLNPFLLDQDHLRNMTALERTRYLTELFAVDTSAEDAAIAKMEAEASELRVKVKMYGSIDMTPISRVDIAELQAKRAAIVATRKETVAKTLAQIDAVMAAHDKAVANIESQNAEIRKVNAEIDRIASGCEELEITIARLEREIAEARTKRDKGLAWLRNHQKQSELARPVSPDVADLRAALSVAPDTHDVDAQLANAAAQNAKADAYEAAKKRYGEKQDTEKRLVAVERDTKAARTARTAKLAEVGAGTGIAGLVFKEGGFEFDGTDSGMLSDSQIMRLSEALSRKYPDGFGLSMIDRGESLGKSVLTLWEEAQARQSTVLVTVVGDKPAEVPEQVGAYVVEAGKVTP